MVCEIWVRKLYIIFIFFQWINLKLENHILLLEGQNCYLNNIEWILSGTNMTLRLKMMMQWNWTEYSLISCNKRSIICMKYIYINMCFDRYNNRKPIKEEECSRNWKTERKIKDKNKNKDGTSHATNVQSFVWNIFI